MASDFPQAISKRKIKKTPYGRAFSQEQMVRPEGFEPPTQGL